MKNNKKNISKSSNLKSNNKPLTLLNNSIFLIFIFFFFSSYQAIYAYAPTPTVTAKVSAPKDSLITLKGEPSYSLSKRILYFEDKNGELSLLDILRKKAQGQLHSNFDDVLNLGFSNSAVWINFSLTNTMNVTPWILELAYAPLDDVELYMVSENGSISKQVSGDSYSTELKEIKVPNPTFKIDLENHTTTEFFIRVKSTSSLQVPVKIWQPEQFTENSVIEMLLWGVYFGALLVTTSYNLFLFVSLREALYLRYVFFVLGALMFQSSINGFSALYIWPNLPQYNNTFLLFSLNFAGLFAGLFCQAFLQLKKQTPIINNIITLGNFALAINIVISFYVSYHAIITYTIVIFSIGISALLIAGIRCLIMGYQPARIYLVAWSVTLIGAIAYSLKSLGYIPSNIISNHSVTIGSFVEVILLSFALGDRINTEKQLKKEAQAKFLNTQKELANVNKLALDSVKQSDKTKQDFLNTMSHELRTPMNGIIGSCQLLSDSRNSLEEKQTIDTLLASAHQMKNQVDRILNFSQLSSGKIKVSEHELNLKRLLETIEVTFSPQAKEKNLRLNFSLDSKLDDSYIGDERKMFYILTDLVDNAIKFTNTGSVSIEVRKQSLPTAVNLNPFYEKLIIRVKDTGLGIDSATAEKLFTTFSQSASDFDRSHGGIGLGLAICKKYVEILQGDINFVTTDGKGTSFEVRIPVKSVPVSTSHKPQANNQSPSHQILIVEDNPTNQMITSKLVKKMGFESKIACNGVEALRAVEESDFTLILMDCQMPVMDGFNATRELRKSGFSQPIIAVTANAMDGDKEKCLECGMSDYLEKPINRKLMEEKLNYWTEYTTQEQLNYHA